MQSVVITGVSRGLGAAMFDRLASRGDRVLAIGRRFTDSQLALADAEPNRIRLITADLAAPTDLREPIRVARATALIHNAAVVEPIGPIGAVPDDRLAAAVAVNLIGPMLLTNAFLAARPSGPLATILFISSGAARWAVENWAAYCATKAGGEMFFNTVAAEHPDVRVHSINPGRMDTAMQATLRESIFPKVERFIRAYEQGELADPADVAARILAEHLADEKAGIDTAG